MVQPLVQYTLGSCSHFLTLPPHSFSLTQHLQVLALPDLVDIREKLEEVATFKDGTFNILGNILSDKWVASPRLFLLPEAHIYHT